VQQAYTRIVVQSGRADTKSRPGAQESDCDPAKGSVTNAANRPQPPRTPHMSGSVPCLVAGIGGASLNEGWHAKVV